MSPNQLTPHASTGIPGLDQLLGGGLPRDRMHLIEGEPGAGKTTLALQFLLEGRRLGEGGLYVTLSETTEELGHVAASHGWTLDGVTTFQLAPIAERAGDEYTLYHPAEIELADLTKTVLERVEAARPARVVFDSLSELRLLARDPLRYRRQILGLKDFFSRRPSTVLLLDDHSAGEADLQLRSLAHGVLLLEHLPFEYGRARRRLRVVKLRGTAVTEGFHDFIIARGGLAVFPQLDPGDTGRAAIGARDQRVGGARRAPRGRPYVGHDDAVHRSRGGRQIDGCRAIPLRRGQPDRQSGGVSVRRAARHLRRTL
jgi:circadian clock protein KaiC